MHEGRKQQTATEKKKHEFETSNIAILANITGIITHVRT